jgi:hypothetical protein
MAVCFFASSCCCLFFSCSYYYCSCFCYDHHYCYCLFVYLFIESAEHGKPFVMKYFVYFTMGNRVLLHTGVWITIRQLVKCE